MATMVDQRRTPERRGTDRRRVLLRRGGRRRHDHLRRRPRRRGSRRRRRLRRARRVAGDHEQRDAGAARAGGRAFPDGAAGEPPPRDGRLGRGHHHREPRVGEPLRTRQRGPGDVRGEREDRVDRAGHGRMGTDPRGSRALRTADEGRGGRPGREEARPRHDVARHGLHGLDRGTRAALPDAVQGARPDDEPDPALDRGCVRGDRGLHARDRRRRRRHARHRARGPGQGADPLDARGRPVRGDRGRRGGRAAAQGDRGRRERRGRRRVRLRHE